MSIKELIEYEIASSWFAPWVSHPWLQGLVARYYARKVKRKYARLIRYRWNAVWVKAVMEAEARMKNEP